MNTITSRHRTSHRRRQLARARRLTTAAPPSRYSAQMEALLTLRRS